MRDDDNYLDWLKDEARVSGEEEQARLDRLREPPDCEYWDSDSDEDDDWTEEDERAATRECY